MRVFVLLGCLVVASKQGPVPSVSSVSNSESQGPEAPGRDVVTWNQSQHGKYNLQVSLKDVQIIALINSDYYDDDDNDDYEYEDGYEDIIDDPVTTVSPPPVDTSTEGDKEDESSVEGSHKEKNTTSDQAPGLPLPLLTFIADGKPENISQLPNDPAKRTKHKRPSTAAGKCGQGFTRDRGGRCRRLRKRRPSFFPFKFPGFAGIRPTRRQVNQHDQLSQGEAHDHS